MFMNQFYYKNETRKPDTCLPPAPLRPSLCLVSGAGPHSPPFRCCEGQGDRQVGRAALCLGRHWEP